MTLADARIAAIDAMSATSKGDDPVADAKAQRSAMTFGQLVEAFMGAPDGPSKATKAEYAAGLHKDVIPALGTVPASEITADQIADCLDEIERRGSLVKADRVKAAVSSVLTWGIRSRRSKGLRVNVCRTLPTRSVSTPRSRGISDAELTGLWHALDRVTEPVAIAARLAWITACRRSEVVGARVCELDLDNARWTIPGDSLQKGRLLEGRTKSGREKVVALSTHAVAMFRRAIALIDGPADYIFPAALSGEKFPHLDPHSVSRAIARVRKGAGAAEVRLHDGRAAARTWMRDQGIADNVLDAALGHLGPSVGDRHYTAASLVFVEKQLRPAMQAWSDHVMTVVGSGGR